MSTLHATRQKVVNRTESTVVQRAAHPAASAPVRVATRPGSGQLMGAMRVSFPSDPAEREAVQTAQRIVTSPTPTSSPIASKPIDKVMRSPYGRRIGVGIIQRQPVIALH